MIPKIGGVIALLMALDFFTSDFVDPWFAVTWGTIVAICLFRTEIISWGRESSVKLSPQLQFALVLFLVLITTMTTRWTALGWQSARQWGLLVFTALPLYWRGLVWAWSHLTRNGISHS